MARRSVIAFLFQALSISIPHTFANPVPHSQVVRERVSINDGWKFKRWATNPDGIAYDHRPDLENLTDVQFLKPWILPTANEFIQDPVDRYERPSEDPPGIDVPYLQSSFDDSAWDGVDLPHDWAIAGPFNTDPDYSSRTGRLPSYGIGWYRRNIHVPHAGQGQSSFLEFEGAMSYAMVWVNEQLVGGWPYGYNTFRLDITEYLHAGDNSVAVRLDNPEYSARWYPGGGIYRNVWLLNVASTRVGHYGTYITTEDVSEDEATVNMQVQLENSGKSDADVEVVTKVHVGSAAGEQVAEFPQESVSVGGGASQSLNQSINISDPLLWGPRPFQTPNVYVACTSVLVGGKIVDYYETQFGIRSFEYDANEGFSINGQRIPIYGVNNHHDLGALGAAFNVRAAERQLEILHELGCNSFRTSHNPPAPELLDLTDRMGFLVMDEIFDTWEYNKTDNDFHLIFPEWHEPDIRNFVRRDRNHPSIVSWSYGNEVYEQNTNETGADLSLRLKEIMNEEDPTREKTASINYVGPDALFPGTLDIISLNYRGAGRTDTNAFSGEGEEAIPPEYAEFHATYPDKMIWSTESAADQSSRGSYFFPVIDVDTGAPVNDSSGGNEAALEVSDTGLYPAWFGQTVDRSFHAIDQNSYVAGEFVWSGWDYLGEPTPYDGARSSYFGIIDLAGFKKDRFYQYQQRWRPDLPMVHLLPHWNWPDRQGLVTPVHAFTSGDEVELFVNGKSQGRKGKTGLGYRTRFDEVVYQPGEIRAVAYKDGKEWATTTRVTTGPPASLRMTPDRPQIAYDGLDLSFLTVEVLDQDGNVVPTANNTISFSISSGPGEIVGTDNGFQGDFNPLTEPQRNAFSGLALGIVKAKAGSSGAITVSASAEGLQGSQVEVSAAT